MEKYLLDLWKYIYIEKVYDNPHTVIKNVTIIFFFYKNLNLVSDEQPCTSNSN